MAVVHLLGSPTLLGPQLLGLGADAIDAFLLAYPKPSSSEVADFLKPYGDGERAALAQQLIARGVDPKSISAALNWLSTSGRLRQAWPTIAGVLAVVSAGASSYHGYKRNDSLPWALWWFLMGSIFPVVTPVIALAQGFGKKKGS